VADQLQKCAPDRNVPDLTIAKVECAWAVNLMAIGSFAPMRGLNVRALFIGGIDPLGAPSCCATAEANAGPWLAISSGPAQGHRGV
jgi:hypothetical protein